MIKEKTANSKLPPRRIISNNLYILKLIHRAEPLLIAFTLLEAFFIALTQFISNIYLLRYAINGINNGLAFSEIICAIILWGIVRLVIICPSTFFNDWYYRAKMIVVARSIHSFVYKKAIEVELECYENPKYYDSLSKTINECDIRADNVLRSLHNLIYMIISFLANFILIITIDSFLALFILIPVCMTFVESKFNKVNYNKQMELTSESRRKDYARRTFYLADYAKEMRISAMSDLMLYRFKESSSKVIGIIKKYGYSLAALQYILHECTDILIALGSTLYAVWKTLNAGSMGYGDCIIIVNSLDGIAHSLTNTSKAFIGFQNNALYIENLRKFLEYEPRIINGSRELSSTGDLVLDNVSFRYVGASRNAISNITMTIGQNEKIAIVGHNGAGKSTLVKLLLRLYDCDGSICYGGTDIKDLPVSAYRNIFSTVMQDYHIFSLTLGENILLGQHEKEDDDRIMHALEKVGLGEKISHLEKGTHTPMTKEFDKSGLVLSGGEQQKLAISRIYTKRNRFVILDEPSSSLDPIAERDIFNNMLLACHDCGVILIAHRLSSVVMADKIYLLENGSIIESGSHSELMLKNGRYAEMFHRQAQNYTEV